MFNTDDYYLSNPQFRPDLPWRFNLKELIKQHAVRLLWGRGYTLQGNNRKEIMEVLEAAVLKLSFLL